VLLGLALPPPAAGQDPEQLQERITEKKEAVKEKKRSLEELTARERQLYRDLAEVEKRIERIEKKLYGQRQELERAENRADRLRRKHSDLERSYARSREEAVDLLEHLWPVYLRLQSTGETLGQFQSWEEADRFFTWLSEIYRSAREKLRDLARQREVLKANLRKQQRVENRISSQLERIERTQDKLLEDKLRYLNKVQKVRAKRMAKEEQLARIRDTIGDLQYKLELLQERKIKALKGHLPWPAQGELVARYRPKGEPPSEGLGFALTEKAPVRAVSWGKVVYNDMLRGFGQVVIIYHGEQYYSLYAFLSESGARVGQDVEKGEVIGKAGFYPESQGPGLYFEMRQGQKTVNPTAWLAKRG
jgi:septal ring factor EnvC (AmiA/AmiB activator)